MANRNPSPKTRFQRGNKANPRGAGAHNRELRAIRKMTDSQFSQVANLLLNGTTADVRKLAADSDAPVIQSILAAVIVRIIDRGDMRTFDMLLNRLIGKSRDQFVADKVSSALQAVVIIPSNGREAR